MKELSMSEIERQDYVDKCIYEVINSLNPSMQQVEWNIEMIADIRDRIQYWLIDWCQVSDEHSFYPFISE